MWSRCPLTCCFCAGSSGEWVWHEPFKRGVFVSFTPLDLLVFKGRHFGDLFIWYRSQELQCLMWTQTCCSSRIFSVFVRSLLLWVIPAWVGFLAILHFCLFYLSQCGLFIHCCGEAVELVFTSFSERIVLYVAVDLVCSGFSHTIMLTCPLCGGFFQTRDYVKFLRHIYKLKWEKNLMSFQVTKVESLLV